jgi:hypothetical protein
VRQRNDSGYAQSVSAWPTDEHPDLAPFEVPPGGECDHPELLAGFTAVADPESTPAIKTAKKTSGAAAAASPEGGEPA